MPPPVGPPGPVLPSQPPPESSGRFARRRSRRIVELFCGLSSARRWLELSGLLLNRRGREGYGCGPGDDRRSYAGLARALRRGGSPQQLRASGFPCPFRRHPRRRLLQPVVGRLGGSSLSAPTGALSVAYLPDFLRLSSLHNIWQFAAVVFPPSCQGLMWSPSISSN